MEMTDDTYDLLRDFKRNKTIPSVPMASSSKMPGSMSTGPPPPPLLPARVEEVEVISTKKDKMPVSNIGFFMDYFLTGDGVLALIT